MNQIYIISTIVVLVLIGIFYNNHQNNKKKKLAELKRLQEDEELRLRKIQEDEKRRKITEELLKCSNEVKYANDSLEKLLTNPKGYINGYRLFHWKKLFNDIDQTYINNNNVMFSELPSELKNEFQKFIKNQADLSNIALKYNKEFIKNELTTHSDFFSNIDGKSLDRQQREAVVIDEDNCLIVAGAGSGKTATIAGKVAYLVKKKQINPNEILLISFTRKSSDEMKERIKQKMSIDVDVKTFNKLGLDIIKSVELENQKSVCGLSDGELKDLFQSFFDAQTKKPQYLSKLNEYFLHFLKPYKLLDEFNSAKESFEYLKNQNLLGYNLKKGIDRFGNEYSYREKFKSQEEVEIANFLYFNRIEYVYESKYGFKTADEKFGQYKPDFYLPKYDIYIEHFGIDRNGNVPHWFKGDDTQSAKEKYLNGIAWKRNLHIVNETILVETYSYLRKEGILLQTLKEKLLELNVRFHPFTDEEQWNEITKTNKFEVNEFVKLLMTFTNLFKSNRYEIDDFEKKLIKLNDERTLKFFELFKPIYTSYQEFLSDREEIDFSDMINNATDYVRNGNYKHNYKYIIVDEFQDISIGRFNLIKSLLDNAPSTKLLCVGDDWQSIYRFSGSDISIFSEFSKYFSSSLITNYKRKTVLKNIETTYRFKKDIIDITSKFILKNSSQLSKELKSISENNNQNSLELITYPEHIKIDYSITESLEKLENELKSINENIYDKKILFLGRYNHDLDKLKNTFNFTVSYDNIDGNYTLKNRKFPELSIKYMTVHGSKGLEADYVFLINADAGKYGFPSQVADDPVLLHLLSHSDQYPNSEERRLFYVALTRCKEKIYVFAKDKFESSFFDELNNTENSKNECPWCGIGKLIIRNSKYGKFLACDNYGLCNYKENIDVNNIYVKAIQFLKNKNYKDALGSFLEVNSIEKNYKKTLYHIGFCYKQLNQKEKAYDFFYDSIKLNNDPQSVMQKFLKDVEDKNLTTSITDLTLCIDNNYEIDFSRKFRAVLYTTNNNFDEAAIDFQMLINKKYDLKNVYHYYANLLENQKKYNEAYLNYKKASDLGNELSRKKIEEFNEKGLVKSDTKDVSNSLLDNKIKVNSSEYRLALIQSAIKGKIPIKINYQKSTDFSDGEKSSRIILPIELINIGASNSLCVRGFCYLRNEERNFALNRISDVIINPSDTDIIS